MNNCDAISQEGFDDILSDILDGTGIVNWEIGPHHIDFSKRVLALSGSGNNAELDRIERLFGLPLHGPNWIVQAGIPPKAWDGFFIAEDGEGNMYEMESHCWKWNASIPTMRHTTIDLFICGDELIENSGLDLNDIVRIALYGEIGERNVARFIPSIRIGNSVNKKKLEHFGDFREWFVGVVNDAYYRNDLIQLDLR